MSSNSAARMQTTRSEAARCFENRNYERAATLFGECLLEGQTSEIWNDWATARFFGGRVAEAERGYRRALELDAQNNEAAENLGTLLASQGRASEAIPFLEKVLIQSGASQAKPALEQLLRETRLSAGSGNEERAVLTRIYSGMIGSLTQHSLGLDRALFRLATLPLEISTATDRILQAIWQNPQTAIAAQAKIATLALDELFRLEHAVELHAPRAVDGNTSIFELVVLNTLLKNGHAKTVFEIGTFDGRTTLNLAANLPSDGRVYTLDLPSEEIGKTKLKLGAGDHPYVLKEKSGARFSGSPLSAKITQLYGDSAQFDFSPYEGKIDFVFIDGAHTRDYVLNDSHAALRLLRDGKGQIAWHDYPNWQSVSEAIHELHAKNTLFKNVQHIPETNLAYLEVGK